MWHVIHTTKRFTRGSKNGQFPVQVNATAKIQFEGTVQPLQRSRIIKSSKIVTGDGVLTQCINIWNIPLLKDIVLQQALDSI